MSTAARPSPLSGARLCGFAAARDLNTARAFYEGRLGLRVRSEDSMALVLETDNGSIRIQRIPEHTPVKFTVLGWNVSDIRDAARRLTAAGVKLERYEWMPMQDESCIATFPNGDMVAWFCDPDSNILSIAQIRS